MIIRKRGYKGVGKKELKQEVLEYMQTNINDYGYTTQQIADLLEIGNNLARESLFRLIRDKKVYRVSVRPNKSDRSTYAYFLKGQLPQSGIGVVNDIDPSIVSWKRPEFEKRYIKKEKE